MGRHRSPHGLGSVTPQRSVGLQSWVMTQLDKVRFEVARYEHLLLFFDARESAAGTPDLVIGLKSPIENVSDYVAPVHPRDIDHPQFEWTFQRYLYDCIHDYMAELFTRNPQELGPRR
jgi:hypothetical protein